MNRQDLRNRAPRFTSAQHKPPARSTWNALPVVQTIIFIAVVLVALRLTLGA